jgi:hypothetical protein
MSPASDSHTPSLGPFRDAGELPLLRLVPPPVRARRVARVLFVAFTSRWPSACSRPGSRARRAPVA